MIGSLTLTGMTVGGTAGAVIGYKFGTTLAHVIEFFYTTKNTANREEAIRTIFQNSQTICVSGGAVMGATLGAVTGATLGVALPVIKSVMLR